MWFGAISESGFWDFYSSPDGRTTGRSWIYNPPRSVGDNNYIYVYKLILTEYHLSILGQTAKFMKSGLLANIIEYIQAYEVGII